MYLRMWSYSSLKPIFSDASEMPTFDDWSRMSRSENVASPRSWASEIS